MMNAVSGSLITQADLVQRFGERELVNLTDRTAKREIVPDVLQKAVNDAEAEVNGYLRAAGFRQPFAPVPYALVVKTCDVCRWYLYENGIPDVVQKRYDNAISWFKLLIKNPSILGFDADGVEEVKVSGGMAVIPNELKDWKDVNNHF